MKPPMLAGPHYSLDIEACGEVLISIGCCEFNILDGSMGRWYYAVLNIQEQLDRGLAMNGEAFLWWLKQSTAARDAVTSVGKGGSVRDGLVGFFEFLPKDAWLWSYPTSFDLPIVDRVYRRFDMVPPWKWTKTMDARTLWQLAIAVDPTMAKIEKTAGEAEHTALADAIEQAGWIAKYMGALIAATANKEAVG